MYNIIGDYIVIVSTLNKPLIHSGEIGKVVSSLVQVKDLSTKEFGTIIPEALYYKIKKPDENKKTTLWEESNKHYHNKKIDCKEENNKKKSCKNKYKNYIETITIYRYLDWKNKPKTEIQAISIYDVFLINFSEIPFEEQVNFFRWLANKHDDLLFAYLISFVTKSELMPLSSNLFKKKKDAIEHLFYNAHLPIEINDNYSTTLCMVARNLRELEELQTTMIRSIVLKASEIIFKERLFSNIDEWNFFHRYSFNRFYRFINFFLYSKIKWITYFIIIPLITVFLIIGLNHLLHLLPLLSQEMSNSSNHTKAAVILQSITILFATVLILFYVLDAYVSGAQKKEACFIKNIFLKETYYSFAIPLEAARICGKVESRRRIRYYPTVQSFIKYYADKLEERIFGETNNNREIMKSLITKFLPNYITARDNALFNILWRQ